jgi:formate hydrogenlyase subunit 4
MTAIVMAALQTLLAVALAPGLVGFIRWLKARLQGRRGAPPWQPYAEFRKLFGKECVVSHTASWVFHVTPFVVFGTAVVAVAMVPLVHAPADARAFGDLFALVYLLLLGTFFLSSRWRSAPGPRASRASSRTRSSSLRVRSGRDTCSGSRRCSSRRLPRRGACRSTTPRPTSS